MIYQAMETAILSDLAKYHDKKTIKFKASIRKGLEKTIDKLKKEMRIQLFFLLTN